MIARSHSDMMARRFLRDIGEGCPGKQMDCAHRGADQTFDMAAKMRCSDWSKLLANAILLAAAPERLAMKLARIVHMEQIGKA